MPKTAFWQKALQGLPASIRGRYMRDIERAERMELALDGMIEIGSRIKVAVARAFAPRPTHQH